MPKILTLGNLQSMNHTFWQRHNDESDYVSKLITLPQIIVTNQMSKRIDERSTKYAAKKFLNLEIKKPLL